MAALSLALALPFGLALAWLLARRNWRGKTAVETFVTLPLVLPPVATGMILLKLAGRRAPAGSLFHRIFGAEIVFTWRGVVLAMMVMSFPFLVRHARDAFEEVSPRLEQVARSLGAGETRVFFTVTLPLALRGVVGGVVLAFARALGEFGATILVAGNIPGRTTTVSLAIYSDFQLGKDASAARLVGISAAIAFAAVWVGEAFLSRRKRSR
ncbi:MAG: molybdate ABC transporter permease subunit [Thermoanaerobaculia bacterium]